MTSRTARALRDAAKVTGVGTHAMGVRPPRTGRNGRAPRIPFALLVVVLVVGALTLLLALNTASAANELRRHELASKDTALEVRLQELRMQVARSAAPANLATAAAALGMVPAGNPAFVVVGKDGKARVMGKPAPATEPPVTVRKPKPRPHSSTSAKPSSSTSSSKSPTSTKSSAKSSSKSASKSSAKKSSTSAKPPRPTKPTSTPTPVVTLPGGTR